MPCYSLTTAAPQSEPRETAVWNTGVVPPADTDSRCRSSHTSRTGLSLLKKTGPTMPGIGAIGCLSLGFRKRINQHYFTRFWLKPTRLPTTGRQRQLFQLPLGHVQPSSSTAAGAMSLSSEIRLLISWRWQRLAQAAQQLCWKTPAPFSRG